METSATKAPETQAVQARKQPTAIICIGMAGSGKTTFMQRLNAHLHAQKQPPYVLNLDPAVLHLPFTANIDIRDTVDYKQVMKQYGLGPNGGIMTALNLFTTKFDQVLGYIDKRSESIDHIIVDTPGQIEIFTWSASGAIITDAMAATYPCVVAYIVDTPRTASPATFMSNMLYACSILYKTKLPFIVVFNKIDTQRHEFALEWMQDFEAFQRALIASDDEDGESNYMSSLMNSMSLVLDEFYNHLRVVGVSAMTGEGMNEFLGAVKEGTQEYWTQYRIELEKVMRHKKEQEDQRKKEELSKLMKDMELETKGKEVPLGVPKIPADHEAQAMLEKDVDENGEDEDDADDESMNIYGGGRPEDYIDLQRRTGRTSDAEQETLKKWVGRSVAPDM